MQSMDLNTIHTQNNKMKNIYVILLYHRYKFVCYRYFKIKAQKHLIYKKYKYKFQKNNRSDMKVFNMLLQATI